MKRKLQLLCLCLLLAFIAPLKASDAPPQKVYTGVYLMNLYDLNVSEYSFYADFYLWFRWKGDLDPCLIEFVNSVEKWGYTIEQFEEEPKELEDGWLYNGFRIEGRFYYSFALHRFPLDKHRLSIRLENTEYNTDSLVYLPDTSQNMLRKDFIVPGWKITNAHSGAHTNVYSTNFGDPDNSRSSFSNFAFYLDLKRPVSYFALKLMLPLLIVIMASLGALFIFPSYMDARISLPIGGLLSCVFLQQSYSSALPDVGYMVLMDKIYLLSYILIAIIMLKVMITGNAIAHDRIQVSQKLCKNNRTWAWILFSAYAMGVLLLIII